MIGIIGAMEIETNGIIDMMSNRSSETISGISYTKGIISGHNCVVATCGPGKVNAAICAQTMIIKYSLRILINTGIAGGIGRGIRIGDIVVAKDVVQHDVDTTVLGDPKALISGINIINIPCSESLIKKILSLDCILDESKIHIGTIATGDQFISNNKVLVELLSEFNAIACEMEGGSIGQVCYINNVEFIVIRAISDDGSDNAHISYNEFSKMAAKNSIKMLSKLLELI